MNYFRTTEPYRILSSQERLAGIDSSASPNAAVEPVKPSSGIESVAAPASKAVLVLVHLFEAKCNSLNAPLMRLANLSGTLMHLNRQSGDTMFGSRRYMLGTRMHVPPSSRQKSATCIVPASTSVHHVEHAKLPINQWPVTWCWHGKRAAMVGNLLAICPPRNTRHRSIGKC